MNFTCLIVDDEVDSRYNLRTMLSESFPQITILGESENVELALKKVRKLQPDILFLDIQLGEKTSFEILKQSSFAGQIVFVTAHEKYALEAIKSGATDYILKPISPKELERAVHRVCDKLFVQKSELQETLSIKVSNKKIWIHPNQIAYFKAEGNYTKIELVNGNHYLVSNVLSHYEQKFLNSTFYRTHRTYLVNSKHISEYDKEKLQITLTNGIKIPVSRRNKKVLSKFL